MLASTCAPTDLELGVVPGDVDAAPEVPVSGEVPHLVLQSLA